MSLNASTLQRAMPGLTVSLAETYVPLLRKAMLEQDITTPARAAAFLAQLGHESVSLRFFEEIWGPTQAQLGYEGRVDLGNTHRGDGKRYKGRGPIQLTGRANYRRYGGLLGLPLEAQPEMAAKPTVGFRTAALFWHNIGGNAIADTGDFIALTKRINGGLTGIDDRQRRLAAIKALGPNAVVPELSKQEKWRLELRERRAQLKTETDPGTRKFLMRRIDELKHALRRFRAQREAKKHPTPVG
jgi:putative chitinase